MSERNKHLTLVTPENTNDLHWQEPSVQISEVPDVELSPTDILPAKELAERCRLFDQGLTESSPLIVDVSSHTPNTNLILSINAVNTYKETIEEIEACIYNALENFLPEYECQLSEPDISEKTGRIGYSIPLTTRAVAPVIYIRQEFKPDSTSAN